MASASSKKVIFAALVGNFLIALTKFIAFFVTKSAAMLSEPGSDELDPAWSPDGRSLVFVRARGEAREIWTMKADGTRRRRLKVDVDDAWGRIGVVRGRTVPDTPEQRAWLAGFAAYLGLIQRLG